MSCINGKSPIDINMSNTNNCYLKCQFTYKYSNVNPIIENNSDYLKLSYENTNQDIIIYNDEQD
jgi:carbonic anhydrase